MIFLIEYNRSKGSLVTFKRFKNKEIAQKKRLALELDLNKRNVAHEVVILEAESQSDLEKTHQRYFFSQNKISANIKKYIKQS